MAVGMVLFWPSLFFIKGDGPAAVEFARLQGEMEALEKTAISKITAKSTVQKKMCEVYNLMPLERELTIH